MYRTTFTTNCRQCALVIWRSGLSAHGSRMTASGVTSCDEEGKYQEHVAATGMLTSIPEGADEPCDVHGEPKIGWNDVLDCKAWLGHVDVAARYARELGYPYFLWNGLVRDTKTLLATGKTVDDLTPRGAR